MRFYLGTHQAGWLGRVEVPLFVSRRRLERYRTLPRAAAPWALDSGGFTELASFGQWRTTARQYAEEARRYQAEIGQLQWAAIQDWMCEPSVREKTGKTILIHKRSTIRSYLELRDLAPEVPWAPVVQGWAPGDYLRHVEDYDRAGVDLAAAPAVGVGSVCRRQGTAEARAIFEALEATGLKLHGFGVKIRGLIDAPAALASADSMAWSFQARRRPALPGCRHRSCSSCLRYAMRWRGQVLGILARPGQ